MKIATAAIRRTITKKSLKDLQYRSIKTGLLAVSARNPELIANFFIGNARQDEE